MLRQAAVCVAVCGASVVLVATSMMQQPPPKAPPQASFRSRVELVPLDVVVVDRAGNPINGLTQQDFRVYDRSKLQAISFFEEVSHQTTAAAMTAAARPDSIVRRDVADNRTAQAQRLVILVVDDLHIYRGRTDVAKDLATQVIRRLGADASMAILFTSGYNSTQVTDDRAALLAAAETLKGRQSWRRPHEANDTQTVRPCSPDGAFVASAATAGGSNCFDPDMPPEQKLKILAGVGSGQDFFEDMYQYKTLEDAARLIGVDDIRRKALVMLSEGVAKDLIGMFSGPLTPCEIAGGACYHDVALRHMMESLRQSNVATYAIDPRGKVAPQDLLRENFPAPEGFVSSTDGKATADESGYRSRNPVRQAQMGLQYIAEAAGGFAIADTDDFAGGISRILEDLDHFYLIGFNPTDGGNQNFRPLDVKIEGHPEWTLRFRKGYMPGGPPPLPKGADPLLAGVMPKTDLPLRLFAIPFPTGTKSVRVAVALEVTGSAVAMKEGDGKLHDDLTYQVFAVDEKKLKVASHLGHVAQLVLKANPKSQGPMPDLVTYQIQTSLDLPPGHYQLRASASSTKLDKGGSVYLMIDVPDFAVSPVAVGGLVLGYADGTRIPVAPEPTGSPAVAAARGGPGGPATTPRVALPFGPSLDREFIVTDVLRVYSEIRRPNAADVIQATVEVVDANGRPMITLRRQFPAGSRSAIDVTLPLTGMAPGAYRVRVAAAIGSKTSQQEVGIVVK